MRSVLLSHTPNGESVLAIIVIGGVDIRGIDVQVVAIRTIVRSRRPPVAVASLIVWLATVEVAGEGEIGSSLQMARWTTKDFH